MWYMIFNWPLVLWGEERVTTNESMEALSSGKYKEWFPARSTKGNIPLNVLILAQKDWLWASDLYRFQVNLCCVEPLALCSILEKKTHICICTLLQRYLFLCFLILYEYVFCTYVYFQKGIPFWCSSIESHSSFSHELAMLLNVRAFEHCKPEESSGKNCWYKLLNYSIYMGFYCDYFMKRKLFQRK